MEGGDMEGYVCALHGKQFVNFCDNCGVLLCPDCTGCEEHHKISFAEMKEQIEADKPDVANLKAQCRSHLDQAKRRLETCEGSVNLDQTALETLKERLDNFKEDSMKDIDAFAKLKEKMAEIKEKAQTNALKEKIDECMKRTFGDKEIKEEEKRMHEEQTRLESSLERNRKDFNKAYQKVLIMGTVIDL